MLRNHTPPQQPGTSSLCWSPAWSHTCCGMAFNQYWLQDSQSGCAGQSGTNSPSWPHWGRDQDCRQPAPSSPLPNVLRSLWLFPCVVILEFDHRVWRFCIVTHCRISSQLLCIEIASEGDTAGGLGWREPIPGVLDYGRNLECPERAWKHHIQPVPLLQ